MNIFAAQQNVRQNRNNLANPPPQHERGHQNHPMQRIKNQCDENLHYATQLTEMLECARKSAEEEIQNENQRENHDRLNALMLGFYNTPAGSYSSTLNKIAGSTKTLLTGALDLVEQAKAFTAEIGDDFYNDTIDQFNDIFDSLYAQASKISKWIEGGDSMVTEMLEIMYSTILLRVDENGKLSDASVEDLFQILLLEMISNPDNYPGMSELLADEEFMNSVGLILQYTGSGSHSIPGETGSTQALAEAYKYVFDALMPVIQAGDPDSLAAQVMSTIAEQGGLDRLLEAMEPENYYSNPEGFITINEELFDSLTDEDYIPPETATNLSPFMAMTLLATLSKAGRPVTAEQWEEIMSMEIDKIEEVLYPEEEFENIFHYMASLDPDNWSYVDGGFDFKGSEGISADYLLSIYEEYPGRLMTEEDSKELMNIMDTTKIIMETLKYFYTSYLDSMQAIARNI